MSNALTTTFYPRCRIFFVGKYNVDSDSRIHFMEKNQQDHTATRCFNACELGVVLIATLINIILTIYQLVQTQTYSHETFVSNFPLIL